LKQTGNDWIGAQQPRVHCLPDFVSCPLAEQALELCELAGLYLDPWQQFVLINSLNQKGNGKLSAMLVGLCVGRQNGKGSILEARQLVGLFLRKEERLLIHSAHQFGTSLEHFRRILSMIENTPVLHKQVKRVARSHGEEGIELKDGSRLHFRTRNKGGARGFTGDTVFLDEAMELPDPFFGALLPTVSARSIKGDPQIWLTGSAVDQLVFDNGIVFARIRQSGHAGSDPTLAYFEWSAPFETMEEVDDPSNPEYWAMANPGMGIRIAQEHIASEMLKLGRREFLVERCGVGDWPDPDPNAGGKIKLEAWNALIDALSSPLDPIFFAFDVSEDRKWATIAASGIRDDKNGHIEVVERQEGTDWVPQRLFELTRKHKYVSVLTHGTGPGASLLHEMEPLGIKVEPIPTHEYVKACGLLYDVVERQTLRHLGQPELAQAIKGAVERQIDDAWAWSRKNSYVDISPLVACTLAHWGATEHRPSRRVVGF
jgi:phage terminase large subunit-like protein